MPICFHVDMVSVNSNNDNKVTLFEAGAGIGAGYATYTQAKKYARKPYGKYILSQLEKLSERESLEFSAAAKRAFSQEKLGDKGIKIVDLTSNNFETFKNDAIKAMQDAVNKRKRNIPKGNTKLDKKLEEVTKKLDKRNAGKLESALTSILLGENACYMPFNNTVVVNPNKMGFSTFHELGHAINNNSKGFVKALAKSRNFIALLAPVVLFTSIVKKKKPEDQKPKNLWDRFTTFIKNNCGKLMFLSMVPVIAEEGLASINGHKLGKKVLSPEMLKKMNTLNLKAFGSYVLGATIMSVCGALAVWVKDRVAQPELAVKKTT